jgi:hypothetical protein
MTASNTTVLELLGKEVSFIYQRKIDLTDISSIIFSEKLSGIVTSVVLSLTGEPELSINDGDYYVYSDLIDFLRIPNN